MKEPVWKRPLALLLAFSMMAPSAMALAPGQGPLNVEMEEIADLPPEELVTLPPEDAVTLPPEETAELPPAETALPEIPEESDQSETVAPAEVTGYAKYSDMKLGLGMATTSRDYSSIYDLTATKNYFAVEGDWTAGAVAAKGDGAAGNYFFNPRPWVPIITSETSTPRTLARVPDYEWVGWREKSDYYDVNGDATRVPTEQWTGTAADTTQVDVQTETGITKVPIDTVPTKPEKDRTLAVVGLWEKSKNADPTALELKAGNAVQQLYKSDIQGKVPAKGDEMDFQKGTREYWLRVPGDQETLDLSLETFEPYYDFLGQDYTAGGNLLTAEQTLKSPVQVTLNTGAVPQMKYQRTTEAEGKIIGWDVIFLSTNTKENPAGGRWTVEKIPLKAKETAKGDYFNDLTVTVTAPDGVTKSSYVFHIQRLAAPTLVRSPGNTPMGQIRQEPYWNDSEKAVAQKNFKANLQYNPLLPGTPTYAGKYFTLPKGSSYDTDEKAVVAYQGSRVKLPAVTLTDTQGDAVIQTGTVKRTVTFRVADTLKIGDVQDDKLFANAATYTDEVTLTYQDGAFQDTLDLTERMVTWGGAKHPLRIVPGIYRMDYCYTDPISGLEYNFDGANFPKKNAENSAEFVRTLVVLPIPGDVDMDGAVTHHDGVVLAEKYYDFAASKLTYDATKSLFALRVCDVDGSGAVDIKDAERLKNGFIPRLEKNSFSDYFYIGLPPETPAERERTPETPTNTQASLSLTYRGMAAGKRSFAAEDPFGATAATARTAPKTVENARTENISNGQTFWLGVHLENADRLQLGTDNKISRMTLAVTYDASYIRPAAVLTAGEIEALKNVGVSSKEGLWLNTVNTVSFSKTAQTVWKCNAEANLYKPQGNTKGAGEFLALPTMTVSPLEYQAGLQNGTAQKKNLRQVLITFSTEKGNELSLTDGDLLFLPFTLVNFPYGKTSWNPADLAPAMSYLAFTTSNDVTYAYDGRKPLAPTCYGGMTKNLRPLLAFPAGGAVTVPLGENQTETSIVYKGVYGEKINDSRDPSPPGTIATGRAGSLLIGTLPAGLSYNDKNGMLTGTPTRAGIYHFYLGESYYVEFVVEKAPLRIYPEFQTTYYGEERFRGGADKHFTYRYYPADIKEVDTGRNALNDGASASLNILLQDTMPTLQFYADDKGSPAAATTDAASYPIKLAGPSGEGKHETKNYRLVFANTPSSGEARLEILPRPVVLSAITGRKTGGVTVPVKAIYDTDSPLISGEDLAAYTTEQDASGKAQLIAERPAVTADGKYGEWYLENTAGVLPGQKLGVSYTGRYTQTEADLQMAVNTSGATKFDLASEFSARRPISLSAVTWLGTVDAKNYKQVNTAVLPTVTDLEGLVTRQGLRRVEIVQNFTPLEFSYGTRNESTSALVARIFRGTADREMGSDPIPYVGKSFEQQGLYASWVTAEQRANGLAYMEQNKNSPNDDVKNTVLPEQVGMVNGVVEVPFAAGQEFSVVVHDGRYLCVYSQGMRRQGGQPVTVAAYSDKPLNIKPLTLDLTVADATRYYGEENGTITKFHYDPNQLSSSDRLVAEQGSIPGGDQADLFALPGVVEGVISADRTQLAPTAEVNAGKNAPVTPADKPIQIALKPGEKAGSIQNYHLNYTGGKLHISRRPIVVDEVQKAVLATFFADTQKIHVPGETVPYKAADGSTNFTLTLPLHTETSAQFYTGGDGNKVSSKIGFAPEAPVILPEDADKLALRYTLRVLPDNGQYLSFANGHFKMDQMVDGLQGYDVEVREIALAAKAGGTEEEQLAAEAAKNNYLLAFTSGANAVGGYPDCTFPVEAPALNSTEDMTYFVPGTRSGGGVIKGGVRCDVALRPIETIQIVNLPKLDYVYGETFQPATKPFDKYPDGTRCSYPLRVHVAYGTDLEKTTLKGKIEHLLDFSTPQERSEDVPFKMSSASATTFDERGLTIFQKSADGTLEGLLANQPLNVADTGKSLVVKGKRSVTDSEIRSTDRLPGNDTRPNRLTVAPKKITVKIGDSYRYYGEGNVLNVAGAGESCDATTLCWADLAAQDQRNFPGMNEKSTIPLTVQNCTTLNITTLPNLQTTANAGTAVPLSGGFPITAAEVALSGNYTATCTPGTLSIYPRPIRIDKINADTNNPLYTIYDNTQNRIFPMDLGEERYTFKAPSAESTYNNGAQSGNKTLPLSQIALRSGDKLATKVKVQFTKTGDFGESDVTDAEVKVSEFTLPQGQKQNSNYFLWDQAQKTEITGNYGAVKIRGIDHIKIIRDVGKGYQYGDTLQLGDLQVEITFKKLNVETAEQVTVPYVGPDQFASYGLFVNYIKESTLREQSNAYYASLVAGRKAAGGDHLTVAPTHDTQPENVPDFTPNGKYLVVSAKLQQNTEYAKPIILDGALSVTPRTLRFDVAATDKTYDAERSAVGSLTLQNVFPADVVYVKTGASYEEKGPNFADYTDYVNHIKNGYVFTTGTYGNPENRLNPYLTYTDPNGYGKSLTFTFHDENVAYEIPPTLHTYGPLTTRSLDVSKIQLGGPDAANYVILEKVTAENLTAAKAGGYQGADLPRATIHKARQEAIGGALPTVQLENHSNAVRIGYNGPSRPGIDAKPSDSLADGFHYEYALQMDDPTLQQDKTPAGFRQWAGDEGDQLFQDTLYFGGEFVAPTPPAGYVPEKQDVPDFKEDDLRKGQLYPWDEADGGVELDKEHYPGGAEYVYEGYKLYKSARKALPRNAVLWGIARVAETHNYLPSRPISSVAGLGAEQAQGYTEKTAAVALAEQKLAENPGDEALLAKYQSALAARSAAGASAVTAVKGDHANGADRAMSDAAERVSELELLADKGQWPKEQPTIQPATAVKTFTERLDVLSTAEKRGSDAKDLTVTTLEALWFTDLLTYPETKYLDAALWNNDPIRYYGYFWDKDHSAALKFDDKEHPLSLATSFEVEIDRKTENGSEKVMVPVNEKGIAQIYVNLTSPSSGGERKITVEPNTITAALGDKPVQLTVTFVPATVRNKKVTWTTSNEKVAIVDEENRVVFVGVGECTLTATSRNKKTATVTVKVTEKRPYRFPLGSFNEGFTDAYFEVDKDNLFYPNKMMTRGELAVLLAKFYRANVLYTASGKAEFPDMPSDEEIADAVALLASKGIMRGTEDGTVCTDEIATRGEIVTMLAQMLALDTPDTDGPYAYKDSGKGQTWAYRYIDAMEKAGLLGGVGDGYFAPDRGLTRAEAAAFLARLLDDMGAAGMLSKPPADVPPDHWGYPAILRAITNLTPPEQPAEGKEKPKGS